MIYYFAPDAEQEWVYITPGLDRRDRSSGWSISLVFKFYIANFTSYNATYGAIGGAIVLMLWFYVSALAVLIGAELNAEIEHASPYGKEPGRIAAANCDIEHHVPRASGAAARTRASDWLLGGLVLGEVAVLSYARLRVLFKRHVES
jgi:uncharacterized BrkB/YihY/UPF0761 family membrane protein